MVVMGSRCLIQDLQDGETREHLNTLETGNAIDAEGHGEHLNTFLSAEDAEGHGEHLKPFLKGRGGARRTPFSAEDAEGHPRRATEGHGEHLNTFLSAEDAEGPENTLTPFYPRRAAEGHGEQLCHRRLWS